MLGKCLGYSGIKTGSIMSIKSRRRAARSSPQRSIKSSALRGASPRVGLSPLEELRLRRRLRRSACSECWVDVQIVTLIDTASDGSAIVSCRFHDPSAFPPGGRGATRMKWCRTCGRHTPPNCIHLIERRRSIGGEVSSATLRCDDCRIAMDDGAHQELWDALSHLRPSGSGSFVRLRELYAERRRSS